MWKIPANDNGKQALFTHPQDKIYEVYNLLEPGKLVYLDKLERLSNRHGKDLKEFIQKMKQEKLLKYDKALWYQVLEPEVMETLTMD